MSQTTDTEPRRVRRRSEARRAANAGNGKQPALAQQVSGQARLLFEPTRIVSDDELESLHLASLEVLETIGIDVMLPQARDYFENAGASVDGERVRIPGDLVMQAIATVPSGFTFHARNPGKTTHGAIVSSPSRSLKHVTGNGAAVFICVFAGLMLDQGTLTSPLKSSESDALRTFLVSCVHPLY